MSGQARVPWFAVIAPGILLAATGVGAGDLLTSTLAGSQVGLALLWSVPAGAILKWVLSEGVARWQLATGTTILEGWNWRLGAWIRWVFIAYLVMFSLVVGSALTSACGVAGTGILPIGEPDASRLAWGVIHSLAGLAFVWFGSFALFEKLMSALVGVMFVTVLGTALAIAPDWPAVAAGFIPTIPASGSRWLLAVLGGVGGTVTLLSYGYWIQEQGRRGHQAVRICRVDLAVGNGVTAFFGVAVLIIGSRLQLEGGGSQLALQMADQLAGVVGPSGRWIFLLGFWGAVFSSLLGVWQSIPYMFADFVDLARSGSTGTREGKDLRRTGAYRAALIFIALAPLWFLGRPVVQVQLVYGVFGALFLPLLALTLLIMNNKRGWVGKQFQSPAWVNVILVTALVFFVYMGFVG